MVEDMGFAEHLFVPQALAVSEGKIRYQGPTHAGASRTSPYPTSRLAPSVDLVDTARQIAEADRMLGTVAHGKLEVIARQIRALQAQAHEILQDALSAAELHRAGCGVQKKVGQSYFLYRRPDASRYFSILSPTDWGAKMPHAFEGAYRLEADMSWSPMGARRRASPQELLEAIGGEAAAHPAAIPDSFPNSFSGPDAGA